MVNHICGIRRLLTNAVLQADRKRFEFLSKVITYRLTGIHGEGISSFHRTSTALQQCVVIIGLDTNDTLTKDVYKIGLQADRVTKLHDSPFEMSTESAACVISDILYKTGVGRKHDETWMWHPRFGWTQCTSMIQARRSHCAAVVTNTDMYVLGRFVDATETVLSSVERYNRFTNQWSRAGTLSVACESAACIAYKTDIYVFGGKNNAGERSDIVQVFDSVTEVCTVLTQRMPRRCYLLRAAMWKNPLYFLRCSRVSSTT